MGITVSTPISIDQFGHAQHWETHTFVGDLGAADDLIPLLGSPERDIWIDAIYVRQTTSTGAASIIFKKSTGANAMTVGTGGTGQTDLTSAYDLDASTDNTWTAQTLVETGSTLKIASTDLLYMSYDITSTATAVDVCIYIRYHSDVTG
jgi:hypothetical protein